MDRVKVNNMVERYNSAQVVRIIQTHCMLSGAKLIHVHVYNNNI